MNWQDFLAEFLAQIDHNPLHVVYQPSCQDANDNEILLGLGNALDSQQIGICLNHKGLTSKSVAEFIATAQTDLITEWRKKTENKLASDLSYIVEDYSADTCLSVVLFWARLKGVSSLPDDWVAYVTRWEMGDTKTSGKFSESWGLLHSALSHYYLQSCDPIGGFRHCLILLLTALKHKANSDQLPELPCIAYQQALFHLHYEYQEYEKSLQHGRSVQLAIPINHCPQRRLLVDAFIAEEHVALGCAKYFLRNDREHTWSKQGFSLMALYRPRTEGSGNEMVVSVEPSSGVYLKDLWRALEKSENEAWQNQRPSDKPRKIHSYLSEAGESVENAPNEPWWDDHGRYTLIAAPKNNKSKLSWAQVLAELWQLYQPTNGLKVFSYFFHNEEIVLSNNSSSIYQCKSLTKEGKRLLAFQWDKEATPCQSMLIPPTLTSILAALTEHDYSEGIKLHNLPTINSYQVVDLSGGLAVLSNNGVVLFNNWEAIDLDVKALSNEFFKLNYLVEELVLIRNEYGESHLVKDFENQIKQSESLASQLEKLMIAKLKLTQLASESLAELGNKETINFRIKLELQWGLQNQLHNVYQTIAQREAALKNLIALKREQRERLHIKKEANFRALITFFGAFVMAASLLKEIVFFFEPDLKTLQLEFFPLTIDKDIIHYAKGCIILFSLTFAIFAYKHEKKSLINNNAELSEEHEKDIHHALVKK